MIGELGRRIAHRLGIHAWTAWQAEDASACVKERTCLICGLDERAIMHYFVGEEEADLRGDDGLGAAIIFGYCARCKRDIHTGYQVWVYED